MAGEFDQYFRTMQEARLSRQPVDTLKLLTDYEVGVDTTIKKYADLRNLDYLLPAETHFFLTAPSTSEQYRVMWLDNGVLLSVPESQAIPVKKQNEQL